MYCPINNNKPIIVGHLSPFPGARLPIPPSPSPSPPHPRSEQQDKYQQNDFQAAYISPGYMNMNVNMNVFQHPRSLHPIMPSFCNNNNDSNVSSINDLYLASASSDDYEMMCPAESLPSPTSRRPQERIKKVSAGTQTAAAAGQKQQQQRKISPGSTGCKQQRIGFEHSMTLDDSDFPVAGLGHHGTNTFNNDGAMMVAEEEGRCLQVTPFQTTLVRKSWQNAQTRGRFDPIQTVFQHTLFKCPEIRDSFHPAPAPGCLKAHFQVFLGLFTELMDNLEDTERISIKLRSIGAKHVSLWESGFRAGDFDAFAQSLLDTSLKWGEKSNRTVECQNAWSEIATFFVEELKEGFHAEKKQARSRRPSRNHCFK